MVVMSSMGAEDMKEQIKIGYCKMRLSIYIMRNLLTDHDTEEAMIKAGMTHEFRRAIIVKPTKLIQ